MSTLQTRRVFLGASAASVAALRTLAAKTFVPPAIGVELYTVRSVIGKDEAGVLKSISDAGYREVEGDPAVLLRSASKMAELQLKPVSCHIPTQVITKGSKTNGPDGKPMSEDELYAALKAIGVEFAVLPYIAPPDRTDEALGKVGEQMTKSATVAKKHGLKFAYHNHAFEFAERNGKLVFDMMFAGTDPKLVQLETDVFWLSVAGVDPVTFLKQHKGRVSLVHLKDKAPEQAKQFNEGVPKETFKEVGSGSLDFKAILDTAHSIGVKHFFVEQDWTPGDPLVSLKKSYDYLRGLGA